MRVVLSKSIHPTVVRVVAAIVLGAATTVAVAWSLALLVDGSQAARSRGGFRADIAIQMIPRSPQEPQPMGDHFALVMRTRRWGTEVVEVLTTSWANDTWQPSGSPHALVEGTSFAAEMKEKFDRGEAPTAWWRGDGWPLAAMSAEARWRANIDRNTVSKVVGGVLIGSNKVSIQDGVSILPLQPIWRGLIIDTLLYIFLWFALFSIGDIRSRLRRPIAGPISPAAD